MKVQKADCPFCNGSGNIYPPPFYRRKKCDHDVSEAYLRSSIKAANTEIKIKKTEIKTFSKKVLKFEGLLLKYFGGVK